MAGLRKRTVFADHGLTVTVEESLELRPGSTDHGRFITGSLKPVAVIVKEPDRVYVFDIDSSVDESI